MTPTAPLKEALAWADRLQAVEGTFTMVGHGGNPGILAAAVRSRDSLLKTAEEEIAGLRKVVEAAKKYRDGMKYNACGCYLTDRNELFDALSATKTGRKL